MKNELPQNAPQKNELAQREEKLRQELYAKGENPETVEAIIIKTREAYAEEVLRRQEQEFPHPLIETHKLNREIWNDGIVSDSEMDSLIQNQSKLQFNFMIMRDLMDHLASTGEYAQHGKMYEVRDKFERLRKALHVNETSISRAKKTRGSKNRTQKDRSIILNLRSDELTLVQGMLKNVQKNPEIQASRQIEFSNEFGTQRIR